MSHTDHPSPDVLSAFSLGQLPPDEAIAVEGHVSQCGPCCDTIVGLASEDTFVELLRTSRPADGDTSIDEIPDPLTNHPRYQIVRLIGRGGMGDVYEARHRMMNRTVALKVINREFVRKPEVVERFRREVEAAAQLSHPNIVTAHDAEQAGDVHFLVMEHVDGTDLSHIVKDRGPLPIERACDFARQAAEGLEAAHRMGLVHRDIKPHNLMVTAEGTVKVLDFGLASLIPVDTGDGAVNGRSDLTSVGTVMGTPDYMSPEQAADARNADARSDVYSLGATLYFLLTGRPLFTEGDVVQKLRSHAEAEPDELESVRGDLPDGLAGIVSRMVAKNPDERFQTAAEVATALAQFDGASNESHVPTMAQHPPRRRGPFSRVTAFAAGFAALLIAAAVYFIVTNNGVVRVEVLDDSLNVQIDGRAVTLDENGKEVLDFRAGDHKIVVLHGETELVTDEFELRRNGEARFRVTVEKGQVVVSRNGEPAKTAKLPGRPASVEWPELRIANNGVDATGLGRVTRSWKLSGHAVGVVTARLVHITDGKLRVANERRIDLSDVPGDTVGDLSLSTMDLPEDRAALSIAMKFDDVPENPALKNSVPLVVDKALASSSLTKTAKWDGYGIDAGEVVLVHWYARLPKTFETLRHSDDLESMVAASKKGASFVVVTLDWVGGDREEASLLPHADVAGIRGKWKVVSMDANAAPLELDDFDFELDFSAETVTRRSEEQTRRPYRIGPTSSPKEIDFLIGGDASIEERGLYELDRDTLRLAFHADRPSERPESFEKDPASAKVVLELERVQDAAGDAPSSHGDVHVRASRIFKGHHDQGVQSLAFSPDGELLASASQLKVFVRKVSNGEVVTEIDRSKGSIVFHPDGKLLAAVNLSGISLWEVATGKKLRTFEADIHPYQDCYGVAFSPDGRRLAVGSEDGLKVWEVESGRELHSINAHLWNGNMTDVAFSSDGTKIASANWGGNVSIDGKTVKAPREVKVWDAETGKRVATLTGGGHGVAFSPDGRTIASGNYFDGTASLWDIATEKEIYRLHGHEHGVAEVAFSPDGRWLATAGRDNAVMVWNTRNGRNVATLPGHDAVVRNVTFSPDGKRLYSSSDDKTIRVWELSVDEKSVSGERIGNAALVYWQAFALLPELSAEDTKLLTDLENGSEPRGDAKSLLARSKTALSLVSRLQPDTPCRWELVEDGPSTLLPHLSKARTLAQLLVLQAKVNAESGKSDAAVDHLTQAFLVARNIDEGMLVQMLVADAIESLAADAAQSLLPKLDASARGRFAEALSQLPKRTTFARAVRYERDVFGRGAGRTINDALEQLGQGDDTPAVRSILGETKKRQAMWLEELLAEYDKVIEASQLPLPEANEELARIEADVQNSSNPLVQLMMPSLVGTNKRHAEVDARLATLETSFREAGRADRVERPRRVHAKAVRVFRGHHDQAARSLATSPDGELLASASQLKVFVRKLSDGEVVTEIDRAKGGVAFDPESKVLAAVDLSGVCLWDVATGKKLRTIKTEIRELKLDSGLAISPDGRRLAFGGPRGLKVWDLESGRELLTINAHLQDGSTTDVAFSPDGTKIASANPGGGIAFPGKTVEAPNEVKVWDAETGKRLATLSGGGHGVAFSPDGRTIASGNYFDGTASVWDIATEKELLRLHGHEHGVAEVAFSPDGHWLATAGRDNLVKVWDVRTGREVASLPGHDGVVWNVVFSPDGKRLYSASEDKTIRVWEFSVDDETVGDARGMHRGEVEPSFEADRYIPTPFRLHGRVHALEYSPDGERLLASGSHWGAALFDVKSGKVEFRMPNEGMHVTADFSPNAKRIALAEYHAGDLPIWDVKSGKEVATLPVARRAARFSSDGKMLFTVSAENLLTVYDLETGKTIDLDDDRTFGPAMIASSPKDTLIAAVTREGKLRVWDWRTRKRLAEIEGAAVGVHNCKEIVFTPDGKSLVVLGHESVTELRDARTLEVQRTFDTEFDMFHSYSLAVSGNGERLAIGCEFGHVVVFDLATGKRVHTRKVRNDYVAAVALSPDGRYLACGSEIEGGIHVLDVEGKPEPTEDAGLGNAADTTKPQVRQPLTVPTPASGATRSEQLE